MKHHPIADVWPMMDEGKLSELADDIRKNGQLVPVWLYEGKIIDGRNRWAACKIAGVTPKTQEYTGDEPTSFAVALNDRRRHMNKGSLAAVAAELEPFFAADAKKRQQDAGGDKKSDRAKSVVAKLPQPIDAFNHDGNCGGGPGPRESALPWARQSRTERAFAASIRRRQRQRGNGVARLAVARGYPRSENLRRSAEG